MNEVEFDMRIGKIPFSFHYLLQCDKAEPLKYLNKIKVIQTDIKNLLDIETVNIGDIFEHRSNLDCISLGDHVEIDKQSQDQQREKDK